MAQHIIRDSKGRVEKILNDKEYAEHQNQGCLFKIFLFIIFIIIVIALAINNENNEGKAGSEKIEKAVPKESSQLDVSTTQSNAQKEDAYSKQQQPSAETTPLLEADMESSESLETIEQESQDFDVSSKIDDAEQEQHLSRKERRALRKARKRMEKEMEKEND